MPVISWSDDHKIGIERIDDQHRNLVELTSVVLDVLEEGRNREDLIRAMDELLGFTLQHFLTEEHMMEANHYPETEAHVAKHKVLLDQAKDFRARILVGDLIMSSFFVRQVQAWVFEHIESQDRDLAEFLKARIQPIDLARCTRRCLH